MSSRQKLRNTHELRRVASLRRRFGDVKLTLICNKEEAAAETRVIAAIARREGSWCGRKN
jgi:hypothetical protein